MIQASRLIVLKIHTQEKGMFVFVENKSFMAPFSFCQSSYQAGDPAIKIYRTSYPVIIKDHLYRQPKSSLSCVAVACL